jgi:phosphate uptake regulator
MGQLARSQPRRPKRRSPRATSRARDLVRVDGEINRLNRAMCNRAVDVGNDHAVRAWAMYTILVARCLERIAGNTIDIAEQTVFVVTGPFGGFADESRPA